MAIGETAKLTKRGCCHEIMKTNITSLSPYES